MLKSVSPNGSVVVHPHIRESVALCGDRSLVVFFSLGGFLFIFGFFIYFPPLFLTTDPKSMLSSLWLCSFHLHSWLSLCVFIHADKLFWCVHDVYMTKARLGTQHSAAFAKGAWLGLPVRPL